jgi:outer membrane protein insertion porin family/translocation and assembly module TamA
MVRVFFMLALFMSPPMAAQELPEHRFRKVYVDSIGVLLDSLPSAQDTVFVSGREYHFRGVDEKGEHTGLRIFDDLTLNLSLQVGEQEERELSGLRRVFSGIGNFIVRIVTLTLVNPGWGSDRFFFDREILETDLRRIRQLYEGKGYYESRIVRYRVKFDDDYKNVEVTLDIYEGRPVRLVNDPEIRIQSTVPIIDPKKELTDDALKSVLPLRKNDPLARDQIDYAKSLLAARFSQNGYPSADVQENIDTTGLAPREAALMFTVIPGRFTVFGDTRVQGNFYKADTTTKIVDDDVILKKVRYKPNRPYDPNQLSLSIGQINGLGVFRTVKPTLVRHKGSVDSLRLLPDFVLDSIRSGSGNRLHLKRADYRKYGVPVDTIDVVIAVAEKKERSIKPGLGFTNDFLDLPKGNNAVLPFTRFLISWQSKNFLGGARKLQVSGEVSKGFEQTGPFFANYMLAKVTFRQPSFQLPLTKDVNNDLVTSVSFERNSTSAFDLRKLEVSPTFFRQISPSLSMTLTPLSFSRATEVIRDEPDNKFFTTNQKLGFTYNTSNDFFNPTSGFLIYTNGDAAGFTLPSDRKYFKWTVDVRRYIGLSSRLTLASRFHVASAIPYYVDGVRAQIPASEQFYGGGPNSIRGWGIRELAVVHETADGLAYFGGNSLLETGIEFRYNLYISRDPKEAIGGMDLAGFVDVGNVWTEHNFKNFKDANGNRLPAQPVGAVGVGMRIRTLIGPVRIDFGYKLKDPKDFKVLDTSTDARGIVVPISATQAKKINRLAFQITLGQAY